MKEFKFIISGTKREWDHDESKRIIAIIAQAPSIIYPVKITNPADMDREIKFGINDIKQKLIEQIVNAEFEYEKRS